MSSRRAGGGRRGRLSLGDGEEEGAAKAGRQDRQDRQDGQAAEGRTGDDRRRPRAIGDRLAAIDWAGVEASLDAQGFAALPALLDPDECAALARTVRRRTSRFRSRIDMARFRFGVGEYKYFAAPLPAIVQSLREELYARLAPIANRWSERLG